LEWNSEREQTIISVFFLGRENFGSEKEHYLEFKVGSEMIHGMIK